MDLEKAIEGMFTPTGHDDLVALVFEVVVSLEFGDDRILELFRACGRRILGVAVEDGVYGGFLDVHRRVEIGFSGPETDNVQPLRPEFLFFCGYGQRGRGFE